LGFVAWLLGVLGSPSIHAQEQAPLPLRVLPMPLGTLCSGVLPSCARNGDTGLHLRIGMLAGLREDRSVGWVQGDAGFLISVMRWTEVGVYLPVTWFGSIRPTLQPLRFGGKVAFLSPSQWPRLWGSAFTEVRIAKGPFSGAGSPLGEQPTTVDVGVAVETRVWLFHAQGMAWLTGSQTGVELHAGAEVGFRGDSMSPFIQARLDSRPGCPPSESPLCGVGGVVLGGLRGSFDAVSATPFAGVGQGSGNRIHPGRPAHGPELRCRLRAAPRRRLRAGAGVVGAPHDERAAVVGRAARRARVRSAHREARAPAPGAAASPG
jgi:hypothetical protein